MVKLEPCPNCGAEAYIEAGSMFGLYRGRCCSYFCDTTGPETDSPMYAAELWNETTMKKEVNEVCKEEI